MPQTIQAKEYKYYLGFTMPVYPIHDDFVDQSMSFDSIAMAKRLSKATSTNVEVFYEKLQQDLPSFQPHQPTPLALILHRMLQGALPTTKSTSFLRNGSHTNRAKCNTDQAHRPYNTSYE